MTNLSERRALHSGIERRSVPFRMADGYSFRGTGAAATDGWQLAAHASITDTPYTVYDSHGPFEETIHRGAFRDTLAAGPDVCLLANHEGLSLARTRSGTLRLAEDDRGLRYDADLDPSSPNAQALRSAVQRGDISESSFAFKTTREQWSEDFMRRSIYAVDISGGDVSACNFGCNKATGEPASAVALRAQLTTAEINDLDDSAFAYIQPGGKKDSSGKTVPRSYRHFCIIDAVHVRNALARIGQGAAFGKEALPAVLKAAAKFGIHVSQANAAGGPGESRAPASHPPFKGTHSHNHPTGKSTGPASHTHSHEHSNDSIHSTHVHSPQAAIAAIANADIASGSLDEPSGEQLSAYNAALASLPDHSLEARLALLRLAAPRAEILTTTEKLARAHADAAEADRIVARLRARK